MSSFVGSPYSDISDEIEKVRSRMVELGCKLGLLHPEVQQCSERLDELLLDYYFTRQNREAYPVQGSSRRHSNP
jgi:hypothetical protein